jgi:Fe-S-cluster containining protein
MNYPFIELSDSEVFSIQKATGMHSDVFTNRKGENFEEYFMQFQNNGYCFFLKEKNGSFSCEVYESRPHICKNFPSESAQQDVCDANSKRSPA